MASGFVQLEELDERLRAKRLVAYLPLGADQARMQYIRLLISNVQAGDAPFARILIATGSSTYRLLADGIGAHLILAARESQDWSLLLTAATAQAAQNATLIVVMSDCRCPEAFIARLPVNTSLIVFRTLDDATFTRGVNFYFFPHVRDVGTEDADAVVRSCAKLGIVRPAPDLGPILKELRSAGAGLVVSVADAQLNWWDATEEVPPLRRKAEATAALLHMLADSVG
jgi:hypothetical protein